MVIDADAVLDVEAHERLVALPVSTHGVTSSLSLLPALLLAATVKFFRPAIKTKR